MILTTETAMLIEQARILRTLASTFDHPTLKDDLLKLAQKCEALAKAKEVPTQADSSDIS
jgi:hypothetical protein